MNIGGAYGVLGGVLVPFVSVASLSVMVVNGLYRFCTSVGAIEGVLGLHVVFPSYVS
jgi:hypothetical protein